MSTSYCSAPDKTTRLFVRPHLGYLCLVGRPEDVQLVYRIVSYVAIGERAEPWLPPTEQSCYAIHATRYSQPSLVLTEGKLLDFGGGRLVRIRNLGTPYWREQREQLICEGELPDTANCLLTYLSLDELDPAEATEEMRRQAMRLEYSEACF